MWPAIYYLLYTIKNIYYIRVRHCSIAFHVMPILNTKLQSSSYSSTMVSRWLMLPKTKHIRQAKQFSNFTFWKDESMLLDQHISMSDVPTFFFNIPAFNIRKSRFRWSSSWFIKYVIFFLEPPQDENSRYGYMIIVKLFVVIVRFPSISLDFQ